jgi:hypothetical protein
MSTAYKYLRFFSRTLLLAGYILLFATQFNSRYYSIANFVEYGHTVKMKADRHSPCRNHFAATPNPAHLGLDKRYAARYAVSHDYTDFTPIAPYRTIARIYYVPLKVYSGSVLTANALRGPPCA